VEPSRADQAGIDWLKGHGNHTHDRIGDGSHYCGDCTRTEYSAGWNARFARPLHRNCGHMISPLFVVPRDCDAIAPGFVSLTEASTSGSHRCERIRLLRMNDAPQHTQQLLLLGLTQRLENRRVCLQHTWDQLIA
jgi:hypothetical protein